MDFRYYSFHISIYIATRSNLQIALLKNPLTDITKRQLTRTV
jgi:hypothetical protein